MADVVQVGDIEVARVVESQGPMFGAETFFPDATPAALEAEYDWMLPDLFDPESNRYISCVQGFVFRTGHHTVLIDTCVGNDKSGRRRDDWNNGAWPYLDNLRGAGFDPGDIDVVMCTHLHVDHAGWNTRLENGRWVPTFPNAKYLMTATELAALGERRENAHPQYKALYEDSVLPVIESGQSVTVEMDHEIDGHVRLEPSPGHTPGHVSVRIGAADALAIATGDMIHHPIQAVYPAWNSRACEDEDLARQTRRAFFERNCDTGTWVLPAHFHPCRITRRGEAFRFVFG